MSSAHQQVETGFNFISDLAHDLNNETLDLPAFPDVALSIKSALENSEVSAEKIAKLVSSDPVFLARILKLANSVIVNGAGHKINDIRTAITRMGFNMAYNTAISIAFDQLKSPHAPAHIIPYIEDCWHHSVKVAAYAYVIAKRQTRINPDSALLAGLLHDIGKYYILSQAENYPELADTPEALEAVLHEWHTGIGRGILEAWKISEDICIAADEHEELGRYSKFTDLTDIIVVANLFSHRDDVDAAAEIKWDDIPATQKLKLSEDSVAEIINESEEEIQSIITALKSWPWQQEKSAAKDGIYDPVLLQTAAKVLGEGVSEGVTTVPSEVLLNGLQPGHMLAANLETTEGQLLFSAGQKITEAILVRLYNYHRITKVREPIHVFGEAIGNVDLAANG